MPECCSLLQNTFHINLAPRCLKGRPVWKILPIWLHRQRSHASGAATTASSVEGGLQKKESGISVTSKAVFVQPAAPNFFHLYGQNNSPYFPKSFYLMYKLLYFKKYDTFEKNN
ncbi:MAG: hypothetical protein BHV78_01355 [Bacteroides sp. CAG:1060_57_27]|nr:MAG: hypothetical protein BHV78_01355 [Bacteroides sp. CAG:1060_57_27]